MRIELCTNLKVEKGHAVIKTQVLDGICRQSSLVLRESTHAVPVNNIRLSRIFTCSNHLLWFVSEAVITDSRSKLKAHYG